MAIKAMFYVLYSAYVSFTDSRAAAVVILMSKYVVYNLANSVCEVTTWLFLVIKIGRYKTGFKIKLNHCLLTSHTLINFVDIR